MKYNFSLIEKDVVNELRRFADEIEVGNVLVSTVVEQKRRNKCDYEIRSLVIKFHQAIDDGK